VPTYEYECGSCHRTFEVRQRISEQALTVCDECGGPVRRLLSAAPFILKGGGWYVTDYPSEARKKGMNAEKSSSSDSSSSSSSTADKSDKPEKSGKPDKSDKPTSTGSKSENSGSSSTSGASSAASTPKSD
jgi:putative FmdB family regulatory protein